MGMYEMKSWLVGNKLVVYVSFNKLYKINRSYNGLWVCPTKCMNENIGFFGVKW